MGPLGKQLLQDRRSLLEGLVEQASVSPAEAAVFALSLGEVVASSEPAHQRTLDVLEGTIRSARMAREQTPAVMEALNTSFAPWQWNPALGLDSYRELEALMKQLEGLKQALPVLIQGVDLDPKFAEEIQFESDPTERFDYRMGVASQLTNRMLLEIRDQLGEELVVQNPFWKELGEQPRLSRDPSTLFEQIEEAYQSLNTYQLSLYDPESLNPERIETERTIVVGLQEELDASVRENEVPKRQAMDELLELVEERVLPGHSLDRIARSYRQHLDHCGDEATETMTALIRLRIVLEARLRCLNET